MKFSRSHGEQGRRLRRRLGLWLDSLAVCSCTVLPLLADIYRRGAGERRAFSCSSRRSTCWLSC